MIRHYSHFVFVGCVLCTTWAQARTGGRELKELINDSDIVASVTASQIVEQDNTVKCELLVENFFKHSGSGDKTLALKMPRPRPGQRPRPDSVVQGQRYLVFLKREGPTFRLSDEILGVIHLRGEKKMRNYILDGSGAKLKRFNEPGLLARVQELTADIAASTQMPKTETPQPQPKKPQKTQKADDNAAPYYEKAISLYVEKPEILSRFKYHLPTDTTKREKAALGKWLQANEKSLEQVHIGTRKSYCKFTDTGDKIAAVMSRLNKIKKPQQAMCLRAELNTANGNFSKTLDDITDCYTMGGHFVAGPTFLIEKMVGISAQAIALQTTFTTIDNQKLDTAVLTKFQNAFEDLTAKYGSTFNLEGEKDYMQDKIKNDTAYRAFRQYLKGALEYYDLVAQKTPWQLKDDKTTEKLIAGNMLLQTAGPGIAKGAQTCHQNNAAAQALTTSIAALRYKTDTGKVPQNLNELITAGYLKALPMDPYSNKPLVYKRTEDGFTLYSMGPNFEDDGGVVGKGEEERRKFWAEDGDAVFWPVQ